MRAFWSRAWVFAKLALRDPLAVFFTLLLLGRRDAGTLRRFEVTPLRPPTYLAVVAAALFAAAFLVFGYALAVLLSNARSVPGVGARCVDSGGNGRGPQANVIVGPSTPTNAAAATVAVSHQRGSRAIPP